jgi:hypothetical protein
LIITWPFIFAIVISWHLRKAAMLREYVHEIKAYILRLEEL